MNLGTHRKTLIAAVGVVVVILIGAGAFIRFRPRTFCEAVADGASPAELTQHMAKNEPARLQTDGWGAYFVHTTSQPYSCWYTIENGRVASAEAE